MLLQFFLIKKVVVEKSESVAYNETETGGSLYATTRQDNNSMQKILKCNGFCESGEPFKSKCGDYKLILFVRDVKTNEIYENE